jgi:hypothetical protein
MGKNDHDHVRKNLIVCRDDIIYIENLRSR